jgi:hypothetical protein
MNLRTILGQDGGGPAATMRHAVLEGLGRTTRADRVPRIRVALGKAKTG